MIIINSGFEVNSGSSMVCTECENITTSIGHTRLELLRLQVYKNRTELYQ